MTDVKFPNAFRTTVDASQEHAIDATYEIQDDLFYKVEAIIGLLDIYDKRFFAIFTTHIEEAMMALRKCISQPHGRIKSRVPSDEVLTFIAEHARKMKEQAIPQDAS